MGKDVYERLERLWESEDEGPNIVAAVQEFLDTPEAESYMIRPGSTPKEKSGGT